MWRLIGYCKNERNLLVKQFKILITKMKLHIIGTEEDSDIIQDDL